MEVLVWQCSSRGGQVARYSVSVRQNYPLSSFVHCASYTTRSDYSCSTTLCQGDSRWKLQRSSGLWSWGSVSWYFSNDAINFFAIARCWSDGPNPHTWQETQERNTFRFYGTRPRNSCTEKLQNGDSDRKLGADTKCASGYWIPLWTRAGFLQGRIYQRQFPHVHDHGSHARFPLRTTADVS